MGSDDTPDESVDEKLDADDPSEVVSNTLESVDERVNEELDADDPSEVVSDISDSVESRTESWEDVDGVTLTSEERETKFERCWTKERVRRAKLLAKFVHQSDVDRVAKDELVAVSNPEKDVKVFAGLSLGDNPKRYPYIRITFGNVAKEKHAEVYRMKDTTSY